jgi:putative transposase
MGLRYPDQKNGEWFFVTTTFSDWRPLGETPDFYERLAESLTYSAKKRDAQLAGYVFMPTHLHMIVGISGVHLGELMRNFKKFVGQKVAKDLGLAGPIWMPRYDRVVIGSERVFRTKLTYIHENPVRSGLVSDKSDWKWSSAADYYSDRQSPVSVFRGWT